MKAFVCFLLVVIILSSCGLYRQNTVNVPMLRQKGQFNAGVNLHANGIEGQSAFAIGHKTAVLLNYSNLGNLRKDYSVENFEIHRQQFGEIGFGIYRNQERSAEKIREWFLLGGLGYSSIYWEGLQNKHFEKASYFRIGMQSDLGKIKGRFAWAFSPGLYFLNFREIADTDNTIPDNALRSYLMTQVAMSASYRLFKPVLLFAQCSLALPLSTYPLIGPYNRYADFSPFNAGIGLRLSIAR